MEQENHSQDDSGAESVFYAHLLQSQNDKQQFDLESICAASPEFADAFRELYADYLTALRAIEGDPPERTAEDRGDPGAPVDSDDNMSRYKILGEIARGGMGTILRVWDSELRRGMAMKVLHAQESRHLLAKQSFERRQSRLLNEAQILAQLDHPGVVPVHGVGRTPNGGLFFTMQLVRGRNLGEIIHEVARPGGEWTLTRLAGVVLKVCETLTYAHSKGVYHRDLKPANVMVGPFGEVYLMDWGLAKATSVSESADIRIRSVMFEEDSSANAAPEAEESARSVSTNRREQSDTAADSPLMTIEGDVLGTPAYMSPEQARGRIEEVDARSDVYGVGAMLYHLLAREPPYRSSSSPRETLAAVVAGPPEDLISRNGAVPVELAAICKKAMNRDRDSRYTGMAEMGSDLRAYLEHRVVQAHESGTWAVFRKWCLRNRWLVASSIAVLVSVLVGLISVVIIKGRNEVTLKNKNEQLVESQGIASKRLEELERSEYTNLIALADQAAQRLDGVGLGRLLDRCDERLRGWEWYYLSGIADSSLKTFAGHEHRVEALAVSTDGRWLGSGSLSNCVRVWDVATGEVERNIEGHGVLCDSFAFSSDAARLAGAARWGDSLAFVWSVESGETLLRLEDQIGALRQIRFSPDDSMVAVSSDGKIIQLYGGSDGRLLRTMPEPSQRVASGLEFSPDGRFLVSAGSEGELIAWDLQAKTHRLLTRSATPVQISFDRAGRLLVLTPGQLSAWNVDTGELAESVKKSWIRMGAVSSDGEMLAVSIGQARSVLQVLDLRTGEVLSTQFGHSEGITQLVFDASDRLFSCSNDRTLKLWNPRGHEVHSRVEIAPRKTHLRGLALAPSGRLAAIANSDGQSLLIDLERGERTQLERSDVAHSHAFSADGSTLAVGGREAQSAIQLWNVDEPLDPRTLQGWQGPTFGLEFARTSEDLWILSTHGEVIRVDLEADEVRRRFPGKAAKSMALDAAEDRLAMGTFHGKAVIWNVEDGTPLLEWQAHDGEIHGIDYSPDGNRIVTTGFDARVKLWDASSGELVFQLEASHDRWALDAIYSPDGRRILSCGFGGRVVVSDAETGRHLIVLPSEDRELWNLAFSNDGQTLLASGTGTDVLVWKTR